MSLLRRKPAVSPEPISAVPLAPVIGKGRPTPKRNQVQGRRGPVPPPPTTQREAIRRSKVVGKTLTKDERKMANADRREKMMRGDDAHVLPRDRGAARAYVRDLVDSRRNFAGLLLPIALVSFLVLLFPQSVISKYGPFLLLIGILAALIDTTMFTRQMSRRLAAKFPNGDGSGLATKGLGLGFYAFNRACLFRKWRVPRAKVQRGQIIP